MPIRFVIQDDLRYFQVCEHECNGQPCLGLRFQLNPGAKWPATRPLFVKFKQIGPFYTTKFSLTNSMCQMVFDYVN